jgi:hypothetical protein
MELYRLDSYGLGYRLVESCCDIVTLFSILHVPRLLHYSLSSGVPYFSHSSTLPISIPLCGACVPSYSISLQSFHKRNLRSIDVIK